jgi:pilus assembly protein CpaE
VIVRRDVLDVVEVQQAMRAGARDVVEAIDLRGLADACARSLHLSARSISTPRLVTDAPVEGKVITVFSPKGGAGKTTISTNLSVALNDSGAARVCLVDLDLAFGDVAITLQLEPKVTIIDGLGMVDPSAGDLAGLVTNFRPNHDCLLAPVSPTEIERIPAPLVTTLLVGLSRIYDYVVVDTPSQLSDHVLAALDASDYIVLITTPELPSLKNLRLTLDVLDTLGYSSECRAVVLNRSDDRVGLSVGAVERVVKCPLAVRVPSSQDVPRSINRGVPIVADEPEHPVSAAIRRLAAERFAPGLMATGKHRGMSMSLPGLLRRRRSA